MKQNTVIAYRVWAVFLFGLLPEYHMDSTPNFKFPLSKHRVITIRSHGPIKASGSGSAAYSLRQFGLQTLFGALASLPEPVPPGERRSDKLPESVKTSPETHHPAAFQL